MSLRRRLLWLFPLCSLSVGCVSEPSESSNGSDRSVRDNPHVNLPDDGVLVGGFAGDGGVPDAGPDVVTVSAPMRYFTASGMETRPGNLASVPQILVPQADGTFVTYSGVADGSGGYVFSNIPKGTYYLKNGSGYIVTDARAVDVGYDMLGRADAQKLPGVYSALFQFNVSNLAPWDSSASFQVVSGEVDMYGGGYPTTAPAAGGTTLVGSNWMDSYLGEMPRFEAARGDRAWVMQNSTLDAGTLPGDAGTLTYTAVSRSSYLAPFSFDGSQSIVVQGAMADPPDTVFPIEWRVPSFLGQAATVHPQATSSSAYFYVMPAAHGLANGWIGYSGELLTLRLPTGYTQDLVRRLSFGNPFPSSWGLMGEVQHAFRIPVQVPGYSTYYNSASIYQMDRLDKLIANPISLSLSPPRELTLDGVSAYTSRMVGSASPVIGWKPPAIGTPTAGYHIRLYKYAPASTGSTTLTRKAMAGFYVGPSVTELRLPSGVLEPAQNYTLEVSAIATPADLTRAPYRINSASYARASATTSLFTTP
ncbi:hypothetical protein [Archangium sp.]|jgi:hypothetical protein|uniref:hypothetical protein n=1 Tax=Archangium sp. TaxID=1872627 RepID=UPI002ED9B8D4